MDYLNKLSGIANTTVIPMLFQFIEKNEPAIEQQIVSKLAEIKNSNPTEYSIFMSNWKKLDSAIRRSETYVAPPPTPVATGGFDTPADPAPEPEPVPETGPVAPPSTKPEKSIVDEIKEYFSSNNITAGRRHKTKKTHKKRTHRVKHRKH